MNAVVLGRGYLGKEFERQGFEVWGRDRFEIKDEHTLHVDDAIRGFDAVINCVGKSDTRWCERPENWRDTLLVNGVLPARLSELCRENGQKFVHISTGCLYDRNDSPQSEDDFLVSHCRYTVSKWVGECGVDPARDLILRPRLFFSGTPDRKNLLCKLPRFTAYLDELNSYTNTEEVVNATVALLNARVSGAFNIACEGFLTVYDLAQLIGLRGTKILEDTLHRREGIFLVNNILDLSKLKRHYQPKGLVESVLESHARLTAAGA